MFHAVTAGAFGEAWTGWSWLEVVGILVLFVGTAVHNGQCHKHDAHNHHVEDAVAFHKISMTPTAQTDYVERTEKGQVV